MKLLTVEIKRKLLANGANRDQDHAPPNADVWLRSAEGRSVGQHPLLGLAARWRADLQPG